jgi:N-acylneuraminate cytidylyltransferase/CMP-N,N'-diacetyllegionaminic acid synthase
VSSPRLCTVLARGNSKGLPGKNLRKLGDKPLIAHAIDQARASGVFDAIAVSSDDESILAAARAYGIEHVVNRPAEMATDAASKLPAIQHCVRAVEAKLEIAFDPIVDLGVTSPLRSAADIAGAVALQAKRGCSIVVSAFRTKSSPYFNLCEIDAQGFAHISKKLPAKVERRQDGPVVYELNGAIYVWRRDALMDDPEPRVFYPDTVLYEMPHERSVDIDTPIDFAYAEFFLARHA